MRRYKEEKGSASRATQSNLGASTGGDRVLVERDRGEVSAGESDRRGVGE